MIYLCPFFSLHLLTYSVFFSYFSLSRTLFSPYEIPVGIVLSLLGGPFFLFLIVRKKGGKLE